MIRLLRPVRAMHTGSARLRLQSLVKRADEVFLKTVSRFHEITGYNAIERLKRELATLESALTQQRQLVKECKEKYDTNLTARSNSQREMNELLLRKSAWTPTDLERFTLLYKDDHAGEQAVRLAKLAYDQAELKLEDMVQKAGKLMGARYREEQMFSDRIRQASTWGTWALMGINILLFLVVTLIVEPYKRRKLVRAFEMKVREMNSAQTAETIAAAESIAVASEPVSQSPVNSNATEEPSPNQWKTLLHRLQQPVVVMRPIEMFSLALASYVLAMLGFCTALAVSRGGR